MPARPWLPSGTTVEVLCGQPGQKCGARMCSGAWAAAASSSSSAMRASRRLLWKTGGRRAANARNTWPASSSASSLNRGAPSGVRLPLMRGRSGMSYSASRSSGSRWARWSSMTRISSRPAAKSRAAATSSGQGMPSFQMRMPCARMRSGPIPASAKAWRRVFQALPRTAMPKRARGLSAMMRFRPFSCAKASAAGSLRPRSRASIASAVSFKRMCRSSRGANSVA